LATYGRHIPDKFISGDLPMKILFKISSFIVLTLLPISLSYAKYSGFVSLEGSWRFNINAAKTNFRRPPVQTGRLKSLGAGYYIYGYLRVGNIYNDCWCYFATSTFLSVWNSGALSLEFLRADYYGGKSTYVLFSRGYRPMEPFARYRNVYNAGYFARLGRYGYGTLEIVENQNGKWHYTSRINWPQRQNF
jgi:hypothetical protein